MPLAPSADPVDLCGVAMRSPKSHLDVTHRARSPEETWTTIADELLRYGITRVADITGIDRLGIPVFYATRPNGKSLSSSSGKGATTMASRVSAAMEGIEISLWEDEDATVRPATYRTLQREGVAPDVDAWLTKHTVFHDDLELYWVETWDIVHRRPVWAPSPMVEYFHGDRLLNFWNCFPVSSNGLASGNTVLEAVASGLFEVVERDAIACAVARHGGVEHLPRIDLSTIVDRRITDIVERFRAADVEPILYDCTNDIAVPTYVAAVVDLATPEVGVFKGYGAHLDPTIAALRALTEAAQSRTLIIAGARDDILGTSRSVATKYDAGEGAAAFLRNTGTPAVIRPDDSTDSFEGDINLVIERLAAAGLDQVLVYRYALGDDHPVEVVRVLVPGCEGYLFEHYRPGPRARHQRELALASQEDAA